MKKVTFLLFTLLIVLVIGCKPKKAVKVEVTQQDTVKVENTAPIVEKVVEIDRGVNLTDKYFLIFNSYTVEEFAQERNKIIQKKGYKSELVMRNDDGYFCLALESYNDFNLAKEAMRRLRKEPGMENVWIMNK